MQTLSDFVKSKRKSVGLTQEDFAERSGVALTVIRKIEQGKTNLNLDKVNLVLRMFGHELGVQEIDRFSPVSFTGALGKLYERGLVDMDELKSLESDHALGRNFNSEGKLKGNRPKLVSDEIETLAGRRRLLSADKLKYQKP